jgi:hypothetical protein
MDEYKKKKKKKKKREREREMHEEALFQETPRHH